MWVNGFERVRKEGKFEILWMFLGVLKELKYGIVGLSGFLKFRILKLGLVVKIWLIFKKIGDFDKIIL